MSHPIRRARSIDCTISSWQAVKRLVIGIPHPNIDRAVRSRNPDRTTVIPAFEDGAHTRECRAPSGGLALRERTSAWRNHMIRFKLLGALVCLSMLSLALPPAFGGQGRQIAEPPWSAACMTDHGPSYCGEPVWIYGAPEQHAPKRHSGFEINQSGGPGAS
jgi:hypothetical protein